MLPRGFLFLELAFRFPLLPLPLPLGTGAGSVNRGSEWSTVCCRREDDIARVASIQVPAHPALRIWPYWRLARRGWAGTCRTGCVSGFLVAVGPELGVLGLKFLLALRGDGRLGL